MVEIDETKLGKRKFNKGHKVEAVCVLAGIERTAEKKVFLVEIEKREVLPKIKKYVKAGSIIYTDM